MINFANRAKVPTAFSFLAAFLSLATLALPANAQGLGQDAWTTAACKPASASFIDLTSAEKQFGFGGGTTIGGQIINSGSGESGLVLITPFTSTTGSDDFRFIEISFKDSTIPATAPHVTVTFCFAGDHGSGPITSIQRTLSSLPKISKKFGWTTVQATSRDFGGRNVRSSVLKRLSFSLSSTGNIVIGNTGIQVGSEAALIRPTSLNFEEVNCDFLDRCTNP
jgi:hypothetical protein